MPSKRHAVAKYLKEHKFFPRSRNRRSDGAGSSTVNALGQQAGTGSQQNLLAEEEENLTPRERELKRLKTERSELIIQINAAIEEQARLDPAAEDVTPRCQQLLDRDQVLDKQIKALECAGSE